VARRRGRHLGHGWPASGTEGGGVRGEVEEEEGHDRGRGRDRMAGLGGTAEAEEGE
jgi:hypothetical protein